MLVSMKKFFLLLAIFAIVTTSANTLLTNTQPTASSSSAWKSTQLFDIKKPWSSTSIARAYYTQGLEFCKETCSLVTIAPNDQEELNRVFKTEQEHDIIEAIDNRAVRVISTLLLDKKPGCIRLAHHSDSTKDIILEVNFEQRFAPKAPENTHLCPECKDTGSVEQPATQTQARVVACKKCTAHKLPTWTRITLYGTTKSPIPWIINVLKTCIKKDETPELSPLKDPLLLLIGVLTLRRFVPGIKKTILPSSTTFEQKLADEILKTKPDATPAPNVKTINFPKDYNPYDFPLFSTSPSKKADEEVAQALKSDTQLVIISTLECTTNIQSIIRAISYLRLLPESKQHRILLIKKTSLNSANFVPALKSYASDLTKKGFLLFILGDDTASLDTTVFPETLSELNELKTTLPYVSYNSTSLQTCLDARVIKTQKQKTTNQPFEDAAATTLASCYWDLVKAKFWKNGTLQKVRPFYFKFLEKDPTTAKPSDAPGAASAKISREKKPSPVNRFSKVCIDTCLEEGILPLFHLRIKTTRGTSFWFSPSGEALSEYNLLSQTCGTLILMLETDDKLLDLSGTDEDFKAYIEKHILPLAKKAYAESYPAVEALFEDTADSTSTTAQENPSGKTRRLTILETEKARTALENNLDVLIKTCQEICDTEGLPFVFIQKLRLRPTSTPKQISVCINTLENASPHLNEDLTRHMLSFNDIFFAIKTNNMSGTQARKLTDKCTIIKEYEAATDFEFYILDDVLPEKDFKEYANKNIMPKLRKMYQDKLAHLCGSSGA